MKKKLSTEYLFERLIPFLSFSDKQQRTFLRDVLEDAKNSEKKNIVDAYMAGDLFSDYYDMNEPAATNYLGKTFEI